ncbi:MAG: phosphatidate cytidylyltransferase [Candidatus Marinimicrobia bacterium]|jgi:phosphatidate cytidylyltransferase|nr:phosphatidate cytidylyltransferase [Candidatus Neomarinimicrobiota bacterium]MBT3618157.1 phosphatidate cytidylyltransferase [Candidatus Neomarinimicrobiota bacterium]MBT3996910.1 phosphatidate cytidylyltransferase [Candidatus Neomarinimicrobiota bacterium]MBT4795953.1 phosphatidate cytidylyltransferase [Candidatus Neomarinimicrobiota bacterium]MBT5339043.1 phosphatidate cytidylyltransferase [Candidatus Neomarinimicrobiota bacterium]
MTKKGKGRTLINFIGIPAIISLIWVGEIYFSIFITLVVLLALTDFYNLYAEKGYSPSKMLGLGGGIIVLIFYHFNLEISSIELIGSLIAFTFLIMFSELFRKRDYFLENVSLALFGILYISVTLGTLILLRQADSLNGTMFTAAVILAVWLCDSACMGAGILWGKTKIIPWASPKKSVQGSIAGLGTSFAVYIIFKTANIGGLQLSWTDVAVFSLIAGFIGQIGDFMESWMKRQAGVKDSGSFLRGHGGVLDRFDSMIFAAPLSYIYLWVR